MLCYTVDVMLAAAVEVMTAPSKLVLPEVRQWMEKHPDDRPARLLLAAALGEAVRGNGHR